MTKSSAGMDSPLLAHYAIGYEQERLDRGVGRLEFVRTLEILDRTLPRPPARIVDVGGGPGKYACWLAERGYSVDLLDPVSLHVDQARQAFEQLGVGAARAEVGDARRLPYGSDSVDAALLLGPLYHLPSRGDRITALREAWRVLRPGGLVFVAAISRFASLLDGFYRGFVQDASFVSVIEEDLRTGRHHNPGRNPAYFTTAYFHHPEELPQELEEAGFAGCELLAVEGPFGCLPNFDEVWASDDLRERMLGFLKQVERDRTLIGASAHLLAHARKP